MINILVLFGVIFLIQEIKTLILPYEYDKQITRIKKDIKDGYLNPNDRPFMIFNFIYFFWSLIGLFTNYWMLFAVLILFGFVTSRYYLKERSLIERVRIRRLESFISALIIISLLITHYL